MHLTRRSLWLGDGDNDSHTPLFVILSQERPDIRNKRGRGPGKSRKREFQPESSPSASSSSWQPQRGGWWRTGWSATAAAASGSWQTRGHPTTRDRGNDRVVPWQLTATNSMDLISYEIQTAYNSEFLWIFWIITFLLGITTGILFTFLCQKIMTWISERRSRSTAELILTDEKHIQTMDLDLPVTLKIWHVESGEVFHIKPECKSLNSARTTLHQRRRCLRCD